MTDKTDEAVARPPGHCDDDKAWAKFTRQYAGQPRSYANMTDFSLANAVYRASPRDALDLLHYQTAAKERIRWLSIRLAEAASSLSSRDARIAELEKDVRDWRAIAADRQAGHSLAEARALKAEALLEKAVKGLEFYAMAHAVPSEGPWGVSSVDFGNLARATLSAITKDQDQ